jgi:hypothetical protein
LREVQRRFAALLLRSPEHGARADCEALARDFVAKPERDSIGRRLEVYACGYPARIHEALLEACPAVAHVVGAEHFAALARRYAQRVPLSSYNLNDVAAAFPAFVREDALGERLPFLADLAELEWRVVRAFHARQEIPLDPARLADWGLNDWGRAVLRFQRSVAVVSSPWPIREIWDARRLPLEEIDLDLAGRPDCVLVRRARFQVQCESIPAWQGVALRALLAGQTLAAVAALPEARGKDPSWVSEAFARWTHAGMITGCDAG